jgi:hypothetical protein
MKKTIRKAKKSGLTPEAAAVRYQNLVRDPMLKSSSRIRKVIMVCPICRKQEQQEIAESVLYNDAFFCPMCEVFIRVNDENGKFLCGALPVTDEMVKILG